MKPTSYKTVKKINEAVRALGGIWVDNVSGRFDFRKPNSDLNDVNYIARCANGDIFGFRESPTTMTHDGYYCTPEGALFVLKSNIINKPTCVMITDEEEEQDSPEENRRGFDVIDLMKEVLRSEDVIRMRSMKAEEMLDMTEIVADAYERGDDLNLLIKSRCTGEVVDSKTGRILVTFG